jgi:hypothetical protein
LVLPFGEGNAMPGRDRVDTGIVEAAAYLSGASKQASPAPDVVVNSWEAEHLNEEQPTSDAGRSNQSGSSPALDFLDDFFGTVKRHLVAIKKGNGNNEIKAQHFGAGDRAGQQAFITEYGNAGFDLYFTPNPVKGTLHKKASKNDIVGACHLWVDLDPRKTEPLEAERAAMVALLTTKLPDGLPRPNRVIDSGRGFWGYWKLDKPAPVDGSKNNVNEPLTETVECYGRGIEQAFGDHFADGCRNIDRIARLPGTVNTKTGMLARVLMEFSHDAPHAIGSFPRSVVEPKSDRAPEDGAFRSSSQYEPIDLTDPLFTKLGPQWLEMIVADDYSADYEGDRSRAEFALVCEAVRVGIDDGAIARLLMDARRKFGAHTRDKPSYRLPRIINRGHDFATDPDLADMNSKFFVAPIGEATRVVSMKDDPLFPGRKIIGRAQSFAAFTDLHSNKRKIWETVDKDGVRKVTKIPLGAWWLRHERRRQYDGGMAFMPQHDQDHVGDVLNTWRGFAVQPLKPEGSSGASGCNLMLDHIRQILCNGNEEHYDFFMKRLASIIQTRRRTEVALALATKVEGTGKGFYRKHVLSALLGSAHMEISNPEHLTGKHNQHLENLLSLCADEALFAGDPRHRNALYSLITEPMITVEPKFIGVYSAPNYLNIDILSNADHYVPASSSARRFFVPTVSPDRAGDFEYFRKIEAQMKNEGGYEALLYHLQHEIDLRHFDVRKVPTTVGLREQAHYSRKGVDLLIETVCNDGRVPCVIDGHPDCSSTNSDPTAPGSLDHMLSKSNDRDLQKPLTVKRRLISEWGCTAGDNTRIWNGNRHLACIRWPALSILRAQFEQRHGPQTWDRADVTEWRELTDATNIGAAAAQAGSAEDVTADPTLREEFEQFTTQATPEPDFDCGR